MSVAASVWQFNRRELAGSLGDLGTLLPLAIGLIQLNGLSPTAVLVTIGLYYLLSGAYFRTTTPVQPMKVVAAYALTAALTPDQISAAGWLLGLALLGLAATGAVTLIGRHTPPAVVRGVQFTTGIFLFTEGVRFMLGKTTFQKAASAAEPFLARQSLGPLPVGIVLGLAAIVAIAVLLDNRVVPAALAVVAGGMAAGLALGSGHGLAGIGLGLHLPAPLPFGWPNGSQLAVALTVLALPQLPMTVGNAIIAQADLARKYFGEETARRQSPRALAASMGLANLAIALLGGMPLCHGAGGLAAHYRFGARTAGSNLMIGALFLAVGLAVGDQATAVLGLLPLGVLGALLVFAGAELALTVRDVTDGRGLAVVIVVLGVSQATNLGLGFAVGLALALADGHRRQAHPSADPGPPTHL